MCDGEPLAKAPEEHNRPGGCLSREEPGGKATPGSQICCDILFSPPFYTYNAPMLTLTVIIVFRYTAYCNALK